MGLATQLIRKLRQFVAPLRGLDAAVRAAVEAERTAQNRTRVIVVSAAMLLVHIGYFTVHTATTTEWAARVPAWRTNLQVIHAVTFCLALALLALAAKRWRFVGEAFAVVYLGYGCAITTNTHLIGGRIDVFVIVIVGTSLVLRLRPALWIAASAIATLVLFIGSAMLQPADAARFVIVNNTIPLVVLSWVILPMQMSSLVRDVAQRRVIEEQLDEMSLLNTRLDRQVRELLIEKSRSLGRELAHLSATEPQDLPHGTVLGDRFKIERRIGVGGMGVVYRADDRLIGCPVAVKLIRFGGDHGSVQRFLTEVAVMAEIDHPAVARSLYVDVTESGRLYQAQELVDGEGLDAVHRRLGDLDPLHAASIGEVLAAALAAAHLKGVVHRDVKPSNVMLTETGPGLKLLDFGVSKVVARDANRTASGVMIGTPAFMPPEQLSATEATTASDIYSLGMTLLAVTSKDPDRDRVDEIGKAIARCLDPNPVARPSAAALHTEFGRLAGSRSLANRNAGMLAGQDPSAVTVKL